MAGRVSAEAVAVPPGTPGQRRCWNLAADARALDLGHLPLHRSGVRFHLVLTSALLFGTAASLAARAQCPDGTLPPCAGVRRPEAPPQPVLTPTYRQLTTTGNVELATLSPDGRFLAYAEGGVLWVRNLVDGGRPVEVSRDNSLWRNGVQWFPDATRLFLSGDSAIYVVPSLGGAPRSLDVSGRARLAGDRKRAAVWNDNGRWIYVVNGETGARQDSVPVGGTFVWLLTVDWSPDARFLAVITSDGVRRYTLRTLSTTNRSARVVLGDSVFLTNPRWDARSSAIYYLRIVGGASQLWKVPVSASTGARTGTPTMVMPFLEALVDVASHTFDLVENGQHLAYQRFRYSANIWMARAGPDTTRRWLTRSSAISGNHKFSPDGRTVAFVQGDPTSSNVFVVGSDSGPATQLTFLRDRQGVNLAWSPSGRRIAYCTVGEAGPQLGIVTLAGTPVAVPAPSGLGDDCDVAWGADDEILYRRVGSRNFGVLPLSGGPERLLVANDSVGWMQSPARIDPSGDRVAVSWRRPRDGYDGLWIISRRDSSQRRVAGPDLWPLRWASDGQTLYASRGGHVYRLDVSRPDSPEATAFPACGGGVDVAPDGSQMACGDVQATSDAWLIRNFDPTARPAPTPRRR